MCPSSLPLIRTLLSIAFINFIICFVTIVNCAEISEKDKCTALLTAGNGSSIVVPLEQSCDIYMYDIQSLSESSFISIELTLNDTTTTVEDATDRRIQVDFNEIYLKNGKKSYIAVNNWTIESGNNSSKQQKVYFSRTSHIKISITVYGIWSDGELKFDYKEVEQDNCTNFITAADGTFAVPLEKYCDIYVYDIKCFNESSIFSIELTLNDSISARSINDTADRRIQVEFSEANLKDGAKIHVVLNRWTIEPEKETSEQQKIYFSRTSHLKINIIASGNWSGSNLKFDYKEVEFDEYKNGSNRDSGVITPWMSMRGRKYRPNCVSVFYINKSKSQKVNSIDLDIKELQIDEGIGEYLLIGAGKHPFQGPPPVFISNPNQIKKFKINDENAYVIFVAASTRTRYRGFNITWKYNATAIVSKDDNDGSRDDDELLSMHVCIYNIKAALAELNQPNPFIEFREELAIIGSEYARLNNKNFNHDIKWTQVHILRVSEINREKEVVYVLVKIKGDEEGTAFFHWTELKAIINMYLFRFASNETSEIRGYKIKACPEPPPRKWYTGSAGFFAMIAISICLFLFIWTWKYNPISRSFSSNAKKAIKARQSQMVPAEDNLYIAYPGRVTVPKVEITNDQGRRRTWKNSVDEVFSSGDQDSDVEVFNKMDCERGSRRQINLKESRSARRSLKRPEINWAYEDDEECMNALQTVPKEQEAMIQVSENYYESITSPKSIKDENITAETKL